MPYAHRVDERAAETIDVLGPTLALLTAPDDDAPAVMRGTLPPGVMVPLHSHPDAETAVAISGEAEGLAATPDGFDWVRIAPGDVFHIPAGAKHAYRNRGEHPAVQIQVTTARLARFFGEAGQAIDGLRSAQAIEHFLATAARYGHCVGTPEENAAVGISLPITPSG